MTRRARTCDASTLSIIVSERQVTCGLHMHMHSDYAHRFTVSDGTLPHSVLDNTTKWHNTAAIC